MKMLRLLPIAGLICLASLSDVRAQDDNPLKAVTEKYVAAFNKGGSDSASFWAEDADYTTSTGETFRGRKAIQELMAAEADDARNSKLRITNETVRVIKPDVALQDGVLEFASPDGAIERSRFTAVWAKNHGQWQLASVRDLGPLPAVEPPAARRNPLEDIGDLAGEWVADDDLASVQLRGEWALGKQFLRFDYQVKPKTGEPFTVLQFIGWDPIDASLRSWFFDSHGGHGSGLWAKTDTGWTVVSSGVTPTGQVGGGSYEYTLSDNTLTMKILGREVAGRPLPDAVVKFKRK